MRSTIKRELEHSRAAYLFSINSLPDPKTLRSGPQIVNGFKFEKENQVKSMLIQLGWAFYCRYEACLEAFISEHKIGLRKKYTLEDWMDDNGVNIPDDYTIILKKYRDIRNDLHHRDGQNSDGSEIHLLPEHMENFYRLFIWIASVIGKRA